MTKLKIDTIAWRKQRKVKIMGRGKITEIHIENGMH